MRVNGFEIIEDEYPWLVGDPVFSSEDREELAELVREERLLRDLLEEGASEYGLWHDRHGTHLESRYKDNWFVI